MKPFWTIAVLTVAAAPFFVAAREVGSSGQLCIAGRECRDYSCGQPVDAPPERRSFTFASGKDSVLVGILEPNASTISCARYSEMELRIAPRRLPRSAAVQIRLTRAEHDAWELSTNARQLEKAFRIFARSGTYAIVIAAPHFQPHRGTVDLGETPRVVSVDLKPLPTLTATVLDDATGKPIAGALIRTDMDSDAVADSSGRFTIEADPEHWPKVLKISAGGYSEASVPLPPARASTNLDEIRLSRGGSVIVTLESNDPGRVMELELKKLRNNGRSLGATVQTISLLPGETALRFSSVEPGDYVVLAKGREAWERLGEPVHVTAAEEAQIRLHLSPFRLTIRTSMQGEALATRVILKQRDALWEGAFTTDSAGAAAVELWQGGRMQVTLEASSILPYREYRDIGDSDSEWFVDVPAYELTGIVVDDATGIPIPQAGVALYMESNAGYSFGFKTKAGDDGVFRFAPVAHGRHTLSAAAAGYPPAEMIYTFLEPEQSRRVTLRLKAAAVVPLTVLGHRGMPIAGARVVDFNGLTRGGVGFTDAAGTVGVQVPPDETRDVYIVPRDGSLGFLQVRSGTERETVRISDGTCRIVLRMESEEREPIANVHVAVRYNGRMLPYEVIQALVTMHGARTKSDARGRIVLDHMPEGIYEFWPVGSPGELRVVASAAGSGDAPLKMTVVPGENAAVMTFRRSDEMTR